MTSKVEINRVLREQGLGNLRYKDGTVFRRSGKTVRSITATYHSPMDCTNEAWKRVDAKLNEVIAALRVNFGVSEEKRANGSAVLTIGKQRLTLQLQMFPSYMRKDDMDPGYLTSAFEVQYN